MSSLTFIHVFLGRNACSRAQDFTLPNSFHALAGFHLVAELLCFDPQSRGKRFVIVLGGYHQILVKLTDKAGWA